MKSIPIFWVLSFLAVYSIFPADAQKSPENSKLWSYVPDTISRDVQRLLRKSAIDPSLTPRGPSPDDLKAWADARARFEAIFIPLSQKVVQELGPTVKEVRYGGIPTLDVRPKDWKDNGKVLVDVHGGCWVFFSARSMLGTTARLAALTGMRVVSVDYTVAPVAKWPQITGQIISVVEALQHEGYPLRSIAFFGDSAGGNLAAAVTLKMRDEGVGMPAALVLWSAVTDFENTADTRVTLKDADPALSYDHGTEQGMLAYADRKDWRNPYVSPVNGDFSKGFPPTLIQVGTKEILLSDSVRLYQAIEAAGGSAKLDVYEGMPHDFQAWWPDSPEGKLALPKVRAFLFRHLEIKE